MSRKFIITEKQYKFLTGENDLNFLNEEMSISDDVKLVANKICEVIRDDMKQNLQNKDGGLISLHNFNFIESLDVYYKHYSFNTLQELNQNIQLLNGEVTLNRTVFLKDNLISNGKMFINFASVNGIILREYFLNTIFHETEHLFQHYKKLQSLEKNNKVEFYNNRVENRYVIASNNLYNPNTYISEISNLIYLSMWDEQDAFIHQMYSLLSPKPKNYSFDALFKQTSVYLRYQNILKLQKQINTWDCNNQYLIEAKNLFYDKSVSFEVFKKNIIFLCDSTIKRLKYKISKVYTNAISECNNRIRFRHHSITPLPSKYIIE